jgi:ADP-heptose:LPS heptosyltransferase
MLSCRASLADDPPRRVAVFRALQLGDMLCSVPALRALRAALPHAEITLVGLPWAATFVEHESAYLDGFRAFPGYPGLPEQPARPECLPAFLEAMRAERFDLAIQLHGSGGVTNRLVAQFGARRMAGSYAAGAFVPDPERFVLHSDDEHEIRRCLRVVEALGAPARGEHLEFTVSDHDRQAAAARLREGGLSGRNYVCIHPGSRAAGRRWPLENYAAVADAFADRGLGVVVTGSRDEAALTDRLVNRLHHPAVNLAGRTDLGTLAGVLEGAALLVCNNTGVMHLAAALGVPGVFFFHEPSEIRRWAPLDRARQRPLCGFDAATVAAVLAEADVLLGEDNPAPVRTRGQRERVQAR